MKEKIKTLSLFFAILLIASSCIKENFDKPPITIPKVDFAANTTIEELKQKYNSNLDSITEDIIIKGIITANDESGNLYKTLFIDDGTAGIEIKIDRTGLYNEYKLGQRIFIKCKGLYIGKYGGMKQLGYIYNNSIGRIPDIKIKQHIFKDSLPGKVPSPIPVQISDINEKLFGRLIELNNVYFEEAGKPFAENTTTNRKVIDENGKFVYVRTSNYADFAKNTIPSGKGKIIGILSVYNNDLQLYIRNLKDLIGFDTIFKPVKTLFSDNFETGIKPDWQIISISSNKNWQYNSSEKCAEINGYQGDAPSHDYLITPKIDLTNTEKPVLQFRSWTKYTDAGNPKPLTVLISTNFNNNPTECEWTELSCTLPAAHSQQWTGSGIIDLSQFKNKTVNIAFKYVSSANSSSYWKIDDVEIKD